MIKVKKMNWFTRLITLYSATGVTLPPFGIYLEEFEMKNKVTVNHEMIHVAFFKDLWYIGGYIWYVFEWIYRIFARKTKGTGAYYNIATEREAYANQANLTYLATREKWSWIKYLKTPKS